MECELMMASLDTVQIKETNDNKTKNRLITKPTRSSAIAEGPRDESCQLKYCQLPRNV